MWLDLVFRGISITSAIIATLRAGSRISYIREHDVIGVMDGPVILKGSHNNETNPMFEISEAFRHSVRLSYHPEYYEYVRQNVPARSVVKSRKTTTTTTVSSSEKPVELYQLSGQPYIIETSKRITDNNEEGQNETSSSVDDGDTKKPSTGFVRRQLSLVGSGIMIVPNICWYSAKQISKTPQSVLYVAKRVWYWRYWNDEDKKNLEQAFAMTDDDSSYDDNNWDYHLAVEAKLRYNSTTTEEGNVVPRIAELSAFAPKTFANLRTLFGTSEADFQTSIFNSGPFVSFQSNSKGAARVGGIFFFTRDGAYMIKTIKKEEAKTFLKMLPKYHRHMKRHARTSLLTRFAGMYGVRLYDTDNSSSSDGSDNGDLQIFTIMNAVFPAEGSKFIFERYDLKGSTVGRETSEEEKQSKGSNAVLKDLDLAREVDDTVKTADEQGVSNAAYGFTIGASRKAALLSALAEDVKLLIDCQVMDYSLLVGVANVDLPYYGSGQCGVDGGANSIMYGRRRGDEAIYYLGLIDFLQPWTTRKVLERKLKGIMGYDMNAISCVTPEEYASRFLQFLDANIS